jgi:hypothetical protein
MALPKMKSFAAMLLTLLAGCAIREVPVVGMVPGTASIARLGDAGTIELSAASGSTAFDIRAGIIADQAALRTLQQYVREVCLR